MGAGVLALPYAFAKLGWVLGICSCILFAATAAYSGILLARVRNYMYPHAASYADLARATVGPRFESFTRWCCLTTWALLLPFYIITCSKAVHGALGDLGWCEAQRAALVAALLILPLQMRHLHFISYAASASTLATFTVVIAACVSLVVHAEDDKRTSGQTPADRTPTPLLPNFRTDFLALYGAFATIIFAYQGQSMFCEIMREMKDSRQFPRSVCVGNAVMMCVYLCVVTVANATDGTSISGFLPDSMPHGPLKTFINVLILYVSGVAYIITGQPFHRALHKLLAPSTVDSPGIKGALPWGLITSGYLGLGYVIANAVPFFADVQALLGALTGAPIVFGWPAFFFLRGCKLNHVAVPIVDRVCCYTFLLLFLPLFTILGVVNAVKAILADWKHEGAPFSC